MVDECPDERTAEDLRKSAEDTSKKAVYMEEQSLDRMKAQEESSSHRTEIRYGSLKTKLQHICYGSPKKGREGD